MEQILGMIALFAVFVSLFTVGYEYGKAKREKKKSEFIPDDIKSSGFVMFRQPEYEFKAMKVTGTSLDDTINEINKLSNPKCLFLQIIETTTYPNQFFKVQMIILCRVEKEVKDDN